MQSVEKIVSPEWIIPIIPKNTVYKKYSIVINHGKIIDILPKENALTQYVAQTHIQLPDTVIMPGFVNLHSHASMNLLRGLGSDLLFEDWLKTKIWPAEGALLDPEFCYEGALLAGAEMLSSGITTTSDMYFFSDSVTLGLRETGLRVAASAFIISFASRWAKTEDEYFNHAEHLIDQYKDDDFVKVTIAPHAPYSVSDNALHRCALLSKEYNLPIHIHVNETQYEIKESLERYNVRPLKRLENLGLLTDQLIVIHNVHPTEEEITQLALANASTCHCPCSNLKLASGIAPLASFLKSGLNVGIGTDGAASNDKLDLLEEGRIAALLSKGSSGDPTNAKVFQILEALTLGGAKALHWDSHIGSLEKGKQADMVAFNLKHPLTLPAINIASHLLYSCSKENISHVWVNGLLQMKKNVSIEYNHNLTSDNLVKISDKWSENKNLVSD